MLQTILFLGIIEHHNFFLVMGVHVFFWKRAAGILSIGDRSGDNPHGLILSACCLSNVKIEPKFSGAEQYMKLTFKKWTQL